MSFTSKICRFIVLFLSLALCISCSAIYQAETLDNLQQSAQSNVYHVQDHGLCAIAQIIDKESCKKYLGANLPGYGYEVIIVNIENTSKHIFRINHHQVVGVTESGKQISATSHSQVIAAAAYSHWRALPWWIFIVPGVFIAPGIHDNIDKNNKKMVEDYTKKALIDVTLKPLDKIVVCVFLQKNQEELDHLAFHMKSPQNKRWKWIIPISE